MKSPIAVFFLAFFYLGHLAFAEVCLARNLHPESAYRDTWCGGRKGQTEFRLPDASRADCLTAHHAVEVEFAAKWKEAVGQSLHYARLTRRQPGIVLILEFPGETRHLRNLRHLLSYYHLNIRVWTITPDALEVPDAP